MESNLGLGRIAGIRVGVHWTVLFIWWLLTWSLATTLLPDAVSGRSATEYWLAGGTTAVALLGCLLAHELSHAIVARRHGVATESIVLWALGGVAQLREDPPSPRSEFFIAGAGPAASLALAVVAGATGATLDLVGGPELATAALRWLTVVNVVLAVFNLLPGTPLDGGRLLHAFLWWRTGDRLEATRSAAGVGRFIGFGLVGLGVLEITSGYWAGLWLVLIGWFLLSAATVERELGGLQDLLGGVTVGDVMSADPDVAADAVTVEELLTDHILRHRHSSFPVEDERGRVIGLVTLADVKRVDPALRHQTSVRDIARPIDQVPSAEASEPIISLMTRLAGARPGHDRRALVVDAHDGRVVGIVTPTDIARALEIGRLTHA